MWTSVGGAWEGVGGCPGVGTASQLTLFRVTGTELSYHRFVPAQEV